jgi:ribosomal protein S18 acetylase RimI-like enzyme
METMTIRHAVPADAARLSEIARLAKAQWGYPVRWLAAWTRELTIEPAYIEAHRVFAAEEAGEVVGFCAVEDHGTHWVLEHLWIDPSRQRRGVGQALLRRALDAVRAVRPGRVTVVADPNAADFYLRLGARPAGVVLAPMPGAPHRSLPVYELVVDAEPGVPA